MLHVEHLTKNYQRVARQEGFLSSLRTLFNAKYETIRAVDDISFDIEAGERVGFIGPNGAGSPPRLRCCAESWCRPAAR